MSIRYMNEAFKRLHESEIEPNEFTEDNELESLLINTVDSLINNNENHIKKFEIALQNVLENYFPEKSWWEVTNINIFMDLFENRDPYGTVHRIIADMYGEEEEVVEENLNEARNYDNADINDKIAKALSRKSFARKYEDELKSHGITITYLDGQGTTLTGPNGRTLSASRKEIYGPSVPGHNGTHYKGYIPDTKWEERHVSRTQEKVNKLQQLIDTLDVEELGRNYPGQSVDQAIESLKTEFDTAKAELERYQERLSKSIKDRESSLHHRHVTRGNGHKDPWLRDTTTQSNINDSPIDYLTYLTKEPSVLRTGKYPQEHTPNISKYMDLSHGVDYAKQNLDRDKRWHSVLEPDELQVKIDELEAEFDRKVRELLHTQEYNKQSISNSYDRLDQANKAKADFIKSLGIGN